MEGRATLHGDLDRPKSRIARTLQSATKRPCTWENTMQEQGTGWDVSSWGAALWEGTWGSWWATSSTRATSVLLRQRKPAELQEPFPRSTRCPPGPACSNSVLSFGPRYTEKTWTGWRGSSEGPQRRSEDWEACHRRRGWENGVCSASRKAGLGETLPPCSSICKVPTKTRETPFAQGATWKRRGVTGPGHCWRDSDRIQEENFPNENNQPLE